MIVKFTCTDPYIASRNGEKKGIVFEGTKKECEEYVYDVFCDNESNFTGNSIGTAIRWSNKRNCWDGIFRSNCRGHRLYTRYDSRIWEIMTKKEAQK